MSDRDRPRISEADLAAARRREPDAVSRIYTAYAPALVRFFRAAVADHYQAEDLAAATFVSAIEALPRFRGSVEAFGSWLFQIARHELYDHRRKEARSRMEPLEDKLSEAAAADGALDPEELAVERLDADRVMVAIRQLPPQQREVLLLRIAGGLTVSEVATILGKTPGAVRALNHRGLTSLARILGVRPSPSERVAEASNNGREAASAAAEIAVVVEAVHAPSAAAPSALQPVRSPEPEEDSDSPSTQVGRRWGTHLRLPGVAVLGGLSLLLMLFSGWSLTVAEWLVRRVAPRLLPKEHRDRYGEEWSAELAAFAGGRCARLGMAVSILVYASSTRWALRHVPIEPKAQGEVLAVKTRKRRKLEALIVGILAAVAVFAGLACSLYLPSEPHPSRLQLGLACLAALLSGVLAAWEAWPKGNQEQAMTTDSE